VGLHVHSTEPGALGALTAALRRGALVALVLDRDVSGTGEPVEFFGVPTRLPTAAVLLGLRTGAPLVPTFAYRLRDARLLVTARPAITLTRGPRGLRVDLQQGLHVVARLLEEGIARAPEQWVVFEPIWKDGAA
jgi:phosphatidylinositol dimannoside acyltransferase